MFSLALAFFLHFFGCDFAFSLTCVSIRKCLFATGPGMDCSSCTLVYQPTLGFFVPDSPTPIAVSSKLSLFATLRFKSETTNYHKLPQTTTNDHKRLQTTTNDYKPLQTTTNERKKQKNTTTQPNRTETERNKTEQNRSKQNKTKTEQNKTQQNKKTDTPQHTTHNTQHKNNETQC